MMPVAAGPARAEAMASLQVVLHGYRTDPRLGDWLSRAEDDRGNLDPFQQANLREMRREVTRARGVPPSLVAREAEVCMRCEQAWRTLRAENNWDAFAPLLAEVLTIKREVAQALGQALDMSPYDALMDAFEPGVRAERVDTIFADLRGFLPGFIDEVAALQAGQPAPVEPPGPFAVEAQRRLGAELMSAVGFDMDHGRLDVSHHPFCGGVPTDVRITTRYDESDFSRALMGVLHETGHAKYEQSLPGNWLGQPVGRARGMSLHEGHSLLQEMQVSRGLPFLRFAAPRIAKAFPQAAAARADAFTPENLHRLYTRVARTWIRVDADEVTYPCHVMLRYEIERDLIAGRMQVTDIPEAWDAGMHKLLGIHTGTDYRNGCMQDIHWAGGAFGYFPTYTLGAMTAAQLFAAAYKALPTLLDDIAQGRFDGLNSFLALQVGAEGSRLTTDEMLSKVSGEPLNPEYFRRHLRARYVEQRG